jgi:DNA-binding NarL/FixJ family response regulator
MTVPQRSRLIIADDHLHVAHSLRALLEPDYEVVDVVSDGVAVIPAVEKHRPDLLLLDLWLPGRNGLDLLTELKRDPSALKVVVLTMHADIIVAVEAMNRGAQGYLLKDSGYEELRDALGQVLGGAPYLSPRVTGSAATTIYRDRVGG